MARKTKAEAELTRHRLLDAAEKLFHAQGVSRTSLHEIAQEAGATRGAIYWHFKGKADLFNAMMERVALPLERALEEATTPTGHQGELIERMCEVILSALHTTVHDEHTRRVFEIASHKVEYVDELMEVVQRRQRVMHKLRALMARSLQAECDRNGQRLSMPVDTAALGLHMLIDGLIHNWLIEPGAFDLEEAGRLTMTNYLRGLGLALPAQAH